VNAVLRGVLFVVTVLTALVALAVLSGRVAVALLPQFEPQIEAALHARGIEIDALDGGWHLLNPVVHAREVRFDGGRASDVTVELDVLESALHRALIVRHVSAAQVELEPWRDHDGQWGLGHAAPTAGGDGFELSKFLRYSDGITLPDVRVVFGGGDGATPVPVGAIRARVALANDGWRHSGEVFVGVEQGGSGELRIAYDLSDALFFRPTSGAVVADAKQLIVDPSFGIALGAAGATIDRLYGRWSFTGLDSTGEFGLDARALTLASGALDSVNVAMRGSTGPLGRRWNLAVDRLAAGGPHGAVDLGGTRAAVESTLGGWSNIDVQFPAFDAANVVAVIRDAAGGVHGVDEWLGGLDPRGQVDGARVRYSFDDHQLSYVANVAELALEDAKGVPAVSNGTATIAGTEHSVLIHLDGEKVGLGFLEYFPHVTQFDHLAGDVLIWFGNGYLAVEGIDLAGTFAESSVHGAFEFGRPEDPLEQRLLLNLRLENIDGREALDYVPRELPQSLLDGLDQAVVGGRVDRADLVYHGHLRTIEGLPMRQVELQIDMHDGIVRFHPDWPNATAVAGRIQYTAAGTTGEFASGNLAGLDIADATVFLPLSVEYVGVQGKGSGDGAALRALIDTTPLAQWLSFVKPDWVLSGPFDFAIDMKVPVAETITPEVDLNMNLHDFTASLTDLELDFAALHGKVHYRFPNEVDAEGVSGKLFERPAKFAVNSENGQIRIAMSGRGSAREITDWRGVPNPPGLADGEFDFTSEYRIKPGSSDPSVLLVQSNLVGVTLGMPGALGKAADEPRPSTLTVVFTDRDRLDFHLGDTAQGWLRFGDKGVRGGSIGIGVPAAPEHGDEDAVTIEGELASLDLTDRLRGEEAGFYPSFPWGMNAFRIGRVAYRNLSFDNVVVDLWNRSSGLQVSVTAPDIEGSMTWPANEPPTIDVHYLRLPALKTPEPEGGIGPFPHPQGTDPLGEVDPRTIGDIDINLSSVKLGDDDFGSWRFKLRKAEQGVAVDGLAADVKGLHIEGEQALWSAIDTSHTAFKGRLKADDLAKVLPQWNYAPSIETASTNVEADVTWPGSPLNFALFGLAGKLSVKAEKGRFVEMGEGSGTVRIFSLLNFAAIAKRMTLDFSDVFGKGISFDKIEGTVLVDRGVINFAEPLAIDGTGGDFRFTGTVNLVNGTLDNEMIVTLPVSSSLPWYAAYLGFVNPIAAGAVLVGERLFRNQIDKFSSAKYKVTGTLQNPEVNFEQVFPKALSVPSQEATSNGPTLPGPVTTPPVVPNGDTVPPEAPHDASTVKDKDA
jgi:uncharacterized protein (TIGR02099 family)